MKRSLLTAVGVLCLATTTFAGGIVTNTNQSAMYTRMGNRVATLGIDAVYYNPAGLTKLGNGFHFSINNQVIGQTRTVITDYSNVLNLREPKNNGEFIGEVSAPLFPGIYGVFKLGKWAFSLGFNPIGGGGGATYNSGLPSFEYPISDVPAGLILQGQNATAYRSDAMFEGTSVFFGLQGNVSYEINDMISIALGARYVMANETYSGHLKNIQMNLDGNWIPYPDYFNGAATAATTAGSGLQAAITGGLINGGDALADPAAIAALTAAGAYNPGMTNDQAVLAFAGVAAQMTATAGLFADQDLEADKSASGITPIVSLNVQPIDMLNIAVKYEHSTQLEFTTASPAGKGGLIGVDGMGNPVYMFTDGEKTRLDMPAQLSLGATLQPIEKLLLAAGYTTFFDKNVVWVTEDNNRTELLSGNSWELGLAAEYHLGDKFLVSAGWAMTATGATPEYQTDMSYSLGTQGISAGFAWDILPLLQLNVGGQFVSYEEGKRDFQHNFANSGTMLPINETLQKSVWVAAVGLNITLAGSGE